MSCLFRSLSDLDNRSHHARHAAGNNSDVVVDFSTLRWDIGGIRRGAILTAASRSGHR